MVVKNKEDHGVTQTEGEREDERGCGNIADAHVKHGGEGGRDGKESLAGITKPRDEVRKPLATW